MGENTFGGVHSLETHNFSFLLSLGCIMFLLFNLIYSKNVINAIQTLSYSIGFKLKEDKNLQTKILFKRQELNPMYF